MGVAESMWVDRAADEGAQLWQVGDERAALDTQVYKQFVENESFKRFVSDMVYSITNP
jgi:hypothetical protein